MYHKCSTSSVYGEEVAANLTPDVSSMFMNGGQLCQSDFAIVAQTQVNYGSYEVLVAASSHTRMATNKSLETAEIPSSLLCGNCRKV